MRRGVAIVNSPLVHVGGVFRILLQCVAEARPFVLLESSASGRMGMAVREHRPRDGVAGAMPRCGGLAL